MDIIVSCCDRVKSAVALSDTGSIEAMIKTCDEIDRLESDADRVMRNAIGRLFRDEQDMRELIRMKAIYEVLESVTDACRAVGNILEGIARKIPERGRADMTALSLGVAVAVLLVAMVLVFAFLNGFHDAANSIATISSHGSPQARQVVLWAAFFNCGDLRVRVAGGHHDRCTGTVLPGDSRCACDLRRWQGDLQEPADPVLRHSPSSSSACADRRAGGLGLP